MDNFFDPYLWVYSAKYSTIDLNGGNFLRGIAEEVPEIRIEGDYLWHGKDRFSLNKAKMLVWYNLCLCQMAISLVDQVNKWGLPKGKFIIDRLGDSDKRVMSFMETITFKTALFDLWKLCAEDHEKKPEYIGFEYINTLNEEGKEIPPPNLMQFAVVDWLVHAAYAVQNGQENRDQTFQSKLENLIHTMSRLGKCRLMHIKGEITWK